MVVAEFKVIPMVEGSLRPYIDVAVEEVKKAGLKYEVEAMGTTMEGELDQVMEVVKRAHQAVLAKGVTRVVTEVSIDERKDGLSLDGKVKGYRS